jgi:hypothetical protein
MFKAKPTFFGNPDRGQDPNRRPYGVEIRALQGETMSKLLDDFDKWRMDNPNIGGGNWGTCKVYKDNKLFGYMSWNGRIWDRDVWSEHAKELKDETI